MQGSSVFAVATLLEGKPSLSYVIVKLRLRRKRRMI
jgi:hypothetical protein